MDFIPNIPVTVWEQISVVIVFSFMITGVGYMLVRTFTKAIADINRHYVGLLTDTNKQWQVYFDARSESSNNLAEKLSTRMDEVAKILSDMIHVFEEHDTRNKQLLEILTEKQHPANPDVDIANRIM